MPDSFSAILTVLFIFWISSFLFLMFYSLSNASNIKDMLSKFLLIDKFKSGNWFGKTLIVLLIIIILPSIVFGIVFNMIMIGCLYLFLFIKKLGGWEENDE